MTINDTELYAALQQFFMNPKNDKWIQENVTNKIADKLDIIIELLRPNTMKVNEPEYCPEMLKVKTNRTEYQAFVGHVANCDMCRKAIKQL